MEGGYNLIMSRCIPALLVVCALPVLAQNQDRPELKRRDGKTQQNTGKTSQPQSAVPPEEDKDLAIHEYGFNPVQAQKEIGTGNYYFKKGSYRAAAGRFEEATKWNSGEPEAWLRLGEAEEKLKDKKAAHEAYSKYLELATDAKNADQIRKKLDKLK
jgi:tetratricopeptide (TPR) repeat protein